ncbi:MAG: TonB-dependent receptor [Rhizomicrobium sp.]
MRVSAALRAFLLASVAAPVFWPVIASADDNIETVTVTAERREQKLIDVPATVTAISGDQIKNLGYTDLKSVIAMVPNAVLPDDSENFETFINIRGVHQADINAEPNFGLYRNGIFNGGQRGNLGAQIDVARVEVLSGPQSGLYGRDAVGGVVNVIYATPSTDGFGGYVTGDYGRYQRSEIQGAVNVPITDNFAVRATGWWINQDEGQLYNITLNQYIDRKRDMGGRLGAKWDVTDQLSVLWTAEIQEVHGPSFTAYAPNGVGAVFNVACCGLPVSAPETLQTITQDTPDTERWQQTYLSQDVNFDTRSWAGTFEWQAAYRNYHLNLQEDQDHTAFGPTYDPSVAFRQVQYRDESLHNFYTQVLWKSNSDQKLTWMAGADYFNETFRFDRVLAGSVNFNNLNTELAPGYTYGNLMCQFLMSPYDGGCEGNATSPGLPGAGAGQYPYTFPNIGVQSGANAFGAPGSLINSLSYSAFATATYQVTDAFSVTADIRWDQTKKRLVYIQGPVAGYGATALGSSYLTPLFAQIFYPYTDRQKDAYVNLAPSVTLQYKLSDSANLYATYATGFRAGSFNLGTSSPQYLSYDPEKNTNYEIGAKTAWLDGRLAVNADFFYMTQTKLVEPQNDPSEPSYLGLYYLANVGDARTYGAELSVAYQPLDWLSLGTAIGWLDDKFTSGSSNGVPVKGQEIPLTRHWTINFNGAVNYPMGDDVSVVGDFSYRLEYGGFLPSSTVAYQDLNKLDINAGFAFGGTRVVGYIDNAFDSVIPQFVYTDGVENVNLGRTYGLRIQHNF